MTWIITSQMRCLPDHQRTRSSNEELGGSKRFSDRMKSILTGQQAADVNNLRELNKKLTRMLEEEMTKNMRLKEVGDCKK